MNWKIKSGEIDLIFLHKNKLIFCEVKTRKLVKYSAYSPFDSINYRKKKKLITLMNLFTEKNELLVRRYKINDFELHLFAVWKERFRSWWIEEIKDALNSITH